MNNYVAYYRVSTARQGSSGLGLEAQQEAVKRFISGELLAEFTEVESGKNDKRKVLQEAISKAKSLDAVLIIAKLDRLSRDAGFIFELKKAGVKFVCADMPEANQFTIGIMAVLAEHERTMISERTKAALKARAARGLSLGNKDNLSLEGRKMGQKANKENAKENNKQITDIITLYKEKGFTYQAIANKLNDLGYKTKRDKAFRSGSVYHIERQSFPSPC